MSQGMQRETSLLQQTFALLWKNVLLKWRRKRHTLLEWAQHLVFVCLCFLGASFQGEPHQNILEPAQVLGRLDNSTWKHSQVFYVPTTPIIKDIVQKANQSILGMQFEKFHMEEQLERFNDMEFPNVTFDSEFEYKIKLMKSPFEVYEHRGYCGEYSHDCLPTSYWTTGFLSLQASIDCAIVELTTNHSIWDSMKSIVAVKMKSPVRTQITIIYMGVLVIDMCLCYVSISYLLTMQITKDRKETREILRVMGLKDGAFWLSWGLLYIIYVLIIANLMTVISTRSVFFESSYGVILLLFFFYGLATVCFTFMLCVLFRKPRLTAIIGFFITFFLSILSLVPLLKVLPKGLEVLLSIFPPFAFGVGVIESMHMVNDLQGVFFSDILGDSSHILYSCLSLILDSIFYIILTLYFDKILPDKHGRRHEPLFFLRSSYWSRKKRNPVTLENVELGESIREEFVEPVSPELHGKEAIRVIKAKKMFDGRDKKIEALRGLDLNLYEGHITALVGHSGAGKTTLLNILSGMCTTTSGSVTIYSYQLSNMSHLEDIQKKIGFCPQFNVKFDLLTVKENLELFAKVKGIPRRKIQEEVKKIVSGLDISDIQHVEAIKLSGGQRRKLTLAVALLGNPEVLLLDEPTAGLDPVSRHHVWSILQERKADGIILFSTQFMDEADILADRKAVLSNGRLKCVGSSLFLKRKWGIGYHLRMQASPTCDKELITSVIKQHIPTAKQTAQNIEDLIYTLPFENMAAFPALFSHLDKHLGQDVLSYGVSMTTLDDVFLKLEGEAEIEKGDYSVFAPEQNEGEARDISSSEMEESILLMADSGNPTIKGMALWSQQVLAVARIRFLKLKHDMKVFQAVLLLLIFFLIPLVTSTILSYTYDRVTFELTPDLYFQQLGGRTHKYYTKLLVNNNTGLPIEDFVDGIKAQDVAVDVVNGPYDADTVVYNGAIEVSLQNKNYRLEVIGNPRATHGFPVLLNIITNTFMKMFNSTEHIQVWYKPFGRDRYIDITVIAFFASFCFMVFASGFAPCFAMSSTDDNKIKARSLLRISSLFPSAYWCGQALVDISLYWFLFFLMIALLFAFNYSIDLPYQMTALIIAEVLCYGASMVLYVYIITFIFGRGKVHTHRWSFFFVIISSISLTFSLLLSSPTIYFTILFFFPPCILGSFIVYMIIGSLWLGMDSQVIPMHFALHGVHMVIFYCIIWFLEWKFGKGSLMTDPLFRFFKRKYEFKENPEVLEDADEEVLAESERVKTLKASTDLEEKPVIIVDSLRKEFTVKKRYLTCKKKTKRAATRQVSLCVNKGEVLGLLGPNGAGKTTSVLMLAGELKPTAGEVVLCGLAGDSSPFLGYCPQGCPLWPSLTVKEHLEIYAAVKGLKKEDANMAIKRVAEVLELKEHLNKPSRRLSAGVSRKVCFAISMLGNPNIVLMDEPSTGLDPKGQQRLWRAIRAAFKNKERGAILTTHYMQEAEAVCDRVAIMVSGKLRCIGSIQQLKSKFGKSYFLEIKVKDSYQVDVIHQEIIRFFPQAVRQDRFSLLLVYKIPMDNVQSLSQAFLYLEDAKRVYNIEEYSFSQPTLEQVFLELAKEQEKEDYDQEAMFKWKRLPTEHV